MARQHSEHHERENRHRPIRQRHTPFSAMLLAAWLGVPVVGLALHLLGYIDVGLRFLSIILVLVCSPAVAIFAVYIGRKFTRREVELPYFHAAATIETFGIAVSVFVWLGINAYWLVTYYVLSGFGALTWMIYRLDAFRRNAREQGEGGGGWGEVFGIPKTRVAVNEITDTTVEVSGTLGPGETLQDVQGALPKIESAGNLVRGRSRAVGGEGARDFTMTLVRQDALKEWRWWPGPSHFGGSITDTIATGYYETGQAGTYYIAPAMSEDIPRPGQHVGAMGGTGSGKSGRAKLELTEVGTRDDALIAIVDATKGSQFFRPMFKRITLIADTKPKANAFFRSLQQLVRDRADLLGQHGYDDWSREAFEDPELRMPAWYIYIDEADEVIMTEWFVWLTTKARSAGVFISVSLPRADSTNMPTTARYSLGTWFCFRVSDSYSEEFALSEETRKAGAHPQVWRAENLGYYYMDGAPGVDPAMYPVPLRTYRHKNTMIERVCDAAVAIMPAVPAYDVESLSGKTASNIPDSWRFCQPTNARTLTRRFAQPDPDSDAYAQDDPPPAAQADATAGTQAGDPLAATAPAPAQAATGGPVANVTTLAIAAAGYQQGVRDSRARDSQTEDDMPDDDDSYEPVDLAALGIDPADLAAYAAVDRNSLAGGLPAHPATPVQDIPDADPDSVDGTPDEWRAAFDALLTQLAREGKQSFTVPDDILPRFRNAEGKPFRDRTTIVKRLTAMCEGEVLSPPGITISRPADGSGVYLMEAMTPAQ